MKEKKERLQQFGLLGTRNTLLSLKSVGILKPLHIRDYALL